MASSEENDDAALRPGLAVAGRLTRQRARMAGASDSKSEAHWSDRADSAGSEVKRQVFVPLSQPSTSGLKLVKTRVSKNRLASSASNPPCDGSEAISRTKSPPEQDTSQEALLMPSRDTRAVSTPRNSRNHRDRSKHARRSISESRPRRRLSSSTDEGNLTTSFVQATPKDDSRVEVARSTRSRSGRRYQARITVPSFDGTDWCVFKNLFEDAACRLRWDDEEKGRQLCQALTRSS